MKIVKKQKQNQNCNIFCLSLLLWFNNIPAVNQRWWKSVLNVLFTFVSDFRTGRKKYLKNIGLNKIIMIIKYDTQCILSNSFKSWCSKHDMFKKSSELFYASNLNESFHGAKLLKDRVVQLNVITLSQATTDLNSINESASLAGWL